MLPLSCTCSLAREDVSYPNFGGAKAPVVTQRRPNVASKVLAAGLLNWSLLFCVWRITEGGGGAGRIHGPGPAAPLALHPGAMFVQ